MKQKLPLPPPISPKIIVRKCQGADDDATTPSSSCENVHLVMSAIGEDIHVTSSSSNGYVTSSGSDVRVTSSSGIIRVTASGRRKKHSRLVTPSSSLEELRMTSSNEDLRMTSSSEDLLHVMSSSGDVRRVTSSGRSSSENNRRPDKTISSQPVRRKDLCKLLGLNNDTDLKSLPEAKIAQKVALMHTSKTSSTTTAASSSGATALATSVEVEPPRDASAEPGKRKNLAKFFGVDDLDQSGVATPEVSADRDVSKERKNFGKESLSR